MPIQLFSLSHLTISHIFSIPESVMCCNVTEFVLRTVGFLLSNGTHVWFGSCLLPSPMVHKYFSISVWPKNTHIQATVKMVVMSKARFLNATCQDLSLETSQTQGNAQLESNTCAFRSCADGWVLKKNEKSANRYMLFVIYHLFRLLQKSAQPSEGLFLLLLKM